MKGAHKKLLEEMVAENFPSLQKSIDSQKLNKLKHMQQKLRQGTSTSCS